MSDNPGFDSDEKNKDCPRVRGTPRPLLVWTVRSITGVDNPHGWSGQGNTPRPSAYLWVDVNRGKLQLVGRIVSPLSSMSSSSSSESRSAASAFSGAMKPWGNVVEPDLSMCIGGVGGDADTGIDAHGTQIWPLRRSDRSTLVPGEGESWRSEGRTAKRLAFLHQCTTHLPTRLGSRSRKRYLKLIVMYSGVFQTSPKENLRQTANLEAQILVGPRTNS